MERSIALCKFNLIARLRWVVGFKTHPLYLWEGDLVPHSYRAGCNPKPVKLPAE
jgi:hypothetical protein